MQYALVDSTKIIHGPRQYHKGAFKSELEDLGIDAYLPDSYIGSEDIVFGDYKIVAVPDLFIPNETLTKQPAGPNYTLIDGKVVGEYILVDKSIDNSKQNAKTLVTDKRYALEVSGTTATIQGNTVSLDTDRASRDIWVQSYFLLPDGATQKFKFPKEQLWLDLTKTDIKTIIDAIMTHIQKSFKWEAIKHSEIDSKSNLVDIDTIEYRTVKEVSDVVKGITDSIPAANIKRDELVNGVTIAQEQFDNVVGTNDVNVLISDAQNVVDGVQTEYDSKLAEIALETDAAKLDILNSQLNDIKVRLDSAKTELGKYVSAKERLDNAKSVLDYHDTYSANLPVQLAKEQAVLDAINLSIA